VPSTLLQSADAASAGPAGPSAVLRRFAALYCRIVTGDPNPAARRAIIALSGPAYRPTLSWGLAQLEPAEAHGVPPGARLRMRVERVQTSPERGGRATGIVVLQALLQLRARPMERPIQELFAATLQRMGGRWLVAQFSFEP